MSHCNVVDAFHFDRVDHLAVEIINAHLLLVVVAPDDPILEESDRQRSAASVAHNRTLTVAIVVATRNGIKTKIGPINATLDGVQSHGDGVDYFLDRMKQLNVRSVHW